MTATAPRAENTEPKTVCSAAKANIAQQTERAASKTRWWVLLSMSLPIERGSDQAAPPLVRELMALSPVFNETSREARRAGHLSESDRATRRPTGKNPPRGCHILAHQRAPM